MLERGNMVIVAVSGGPDSVALLKALNIFSDEYRLTLIIAHLNHGLRGEESNNDEEFVRKLSESMGIEFEYKYRYFLSPAEEGEVRRGDRERGEVSISR